jgi:hypothetical protein
MGWYFDHYKIGKTRQWVGAPVPIVVRYRYQFPSDFKEIDLSPPVSPSVQILTEKGSTQDGSKAPFKRESFDTWRGMLDTKVLGPGRYELVFILDEKDAIHASDQPLFLFSPEDYRAELKEDAAELFLPSPGVSNSHQILGLLQTKLIAKLPANLFTEPPGIRIEPGEHVELNEPVATAPISWVLDALITEFVYLWTSARNSVPTVWDLELKGDLLSLGFGMKFFDDLDQAIASSVSNRELGVLHLLGDTGKTPFRSETYVSSTDARVRVWFNIF